MIVLSFVNRPSDLMIGGSFGVIERMWRTRIELLIESNVNLFVVNFSFTCRFGYSTA